MNWLKYTFLQPTICIVPKNIASQYFGTARPRFQSHCWLNRCIFYQLFDQLLAIFHSREVFFYLNGQKDGQNLVKQLVKILAKVTPKVSLKPFCCKKRNVDLFRKYSNCEINRSEEFLRKKEFGSDQS